MSRITCARAGYIALSARSPMAATVEPRVSFRRVRVMLTTSLSSRSLQAIHNELVWIGLAPPRNVCDIPGVRVKIDPNVPCFLVEPTAHPSSKHATLVGWEREILGTCNARRVDHNLCLSDRRKNRSGNCHEQSKRPHAPSIFGIGDAARVKASLVCRTSLILWLNLSTSSMKSF